MLKIFASYKRADRPFLDLLLPLLRRVHGKDSIWFDDDIPGGSAWWPVILYHIDLCPAFVFLMSNDALRSEYCLAELREAIRLNKQVFPVICRLQTELPKDLDPELATFLRNRNWITLVNRQGGIDPEQMVRLNEDIRDALNQLPADILPPKTPEPTPEPQVKDKPKPRLGMSISWAVGLMIVLLAAVIFAVLRGQTETPSDSSTPTLSATTAVAVVDVESPTPTESPTDSASATPSDTPTLTLSPTITDTPDFVVAAQTVAAQGTLDYDNARAAETVMAATLYREQTATQTTLYEQQTATQAAIGTATATQWTKTPTPDATLTITALIADWATQTQAAHFTATVTLWTYTPMPTSTSNREPQLVVIVKDGISVRQSDSFESPRVGAIAEGETVELLGVTPSGTWFLVRTNTGQGWISRTLVTDGLIQLYGDLEILPVIRPYKTSTPTPDPDALPP